MTTYRAVPLIRVLEEPDEPFPFGVQLGLEVVARFRMGGHAETFADHLREVWHADPARAAQRVIERELGGL